MLFYPKQGQLHAYDTSHFHIENALLLLMAIDYLKNNAIFFFILSWLGFRMCVCGIFF